SQHAALPAINAAHQLGLITDPLPAAPFRDKPSTKAAPERSKLPVAEPEPEGSKWGNAASVRETSGSGIKVDPVHLTPAVEMDLARRRDVGILADAALAGIPAARDITAGVGEDQLGRLAAD